MSIALVPIIGATNYFASNDWITLARNPGSTSFNFTSTISNQCPNPNFDPVQWLDPPFNTIPNPNYDPNPTITEVINWLNNPFLINTGATINDTTFTVSASTSCNTDSQIYHYEVIEPKVVYERIPNTTSILFIDVTRRSTYTHRHLIPVTNNTWMQNPYLTRGRIIVEVFNVGLGIWQQVANFALNGQQIVEDLSQFPCQYRTRYEIRQIPNCGGTSPLLFEAVGQQFTLATWLYLLPSPTILSVNTAEDYKLHWCTIPERVDDITTHVEHYVTVEVGYDFEINVQSSNENYTYQYTTSSALNLPVASVSYLEPQRRIQGRYLAKQLLTVNDVLFQGTANEFIDGILINTANAYQETLDISIEGYRPDIIVPVPQVRCSYNYQITDDTVIDSPCLEERGKVYYEYWNDYTEEWVLCDTIERLQVIVQDNCEAGLVKIRNKYKYDYYKKSCGCDPAIYQNILESQWYEYTFNVLEYKPEIILPKLPCCYVINEPITIQPSTMVLNNLPNSCPLVPVIGDNTLTYRLYYYDYILDTWNVIGTPVVYNVVEPIVLAAYPFTFTPDKLGSYKIEATLRNCCTSIIKEILITVCNSFDILKKCYTTTDVCTCGLYNIINYTSSTVYQVRINKWMLDRSRNNLNAGTFIEIDRLTLAASSSTDYTLQDGVYNIDFYDSLGLTLLKSTRLYVFCQIQKCYDEYLKQMLCNPNDTCDDKPCQSQMYKTNKIMALYQLYMMKVNEANKLNIIWINPDIQNDIQVIVNLEQIYQQLLEFCNPCLKNGDCGQTKSPYHQSNSKPVTGYTSITKNNTQQTGGCGCG